MILSSTFHSLSILLFCYYIFFPHSLAGTSGRFTLDGSAEFIWNCLPAFLGVLGSNFFFLDVLKLSIGPNFAVNGTGCVACSHIILKIFSHSLIRFQLIHNKEPNKTKKSNKIRDWQRNSMIIYARKLSIRFSKVKSSNLCLIGYSPVVSPLFSSTFYKPVSTVIIINRPYW